MEKRRGYHGRVTLLSPDEEKRVTIEVPGRWRCGDGHLIINRWYSDSAERLEKNFQRLLSAGWKVVKENDQPTVENTEGKVGEEEKKKTDLVIGTTKSGNASHGGKHASGEVEDSPNAAKKERRRRKCRGGQKYRRNLRYRLSKRRVRIEVQSVGKKGIAGVYAPQPLKVSNGLLESAERSAELLAELVGRSHLKVRRGVTVNAEKLLVALEIGDNPLPALEVPDERPKVKILVTPDCSGSTQDWNSLGQAWALHLSRLPDVDVVYFTNYNGELWEVKGDTETRKLIESVDVLLYLGDGDGHELCRRYASFGATVLALDSYCANSANPRLKKENYRQGSLFWVDRVSANDPDTWTRALELCLKV